MMMNLNHVQFDEKLHRYLGKPGDPASPRPHYYGVEQPDFDPENPYRQTNVGLFPGWIRDENGEKRDYLMYIPSTMKTSGSAMIVFIPGGEAPERFFRDYGWQQALESFEISALFLPSGKNGWDLENPGFEIDAAAKAKAQLCSNEYFLSNAPAFYCLGFGDDGAKIASVFAMLYHCVVAAFAACGDTELDPALLEKIGNAPSDGDPLIPRKAVQVPAYLIGPRPTNVLGYFMEACHVKEEGLHNDYAHIWQQGKRLGDCRLDNDLGCEVWFTERGVKEVADDNGTMMEDEEEISRPEKAIEFTATDIRRMISFVDRYMSWGISGNPAIRRNEHLYHHTALKRREKRYDGLIRRWYMFEPSAYRLGRKEKYPLVIAIHGFSCSGPFFAANSGWHQVGEARGFFVCYPTAYPIHPQTAVPDDGDTPAASDNPVVSSVMTPGRAVTVAWQTGSAGMGSTGVDEISFYRQLIDDLCSEYPIDQERIYVTGHSNGSQMTQVLMRHMPGRFAGFAPVGFMECVDEEKPAPTDGIARNPWYVVGEHDIHDDSLEGDTWNTMTLRMIAKANGIDYDLSHRFESGNYRHLVMKNAKNEPLVRFTGIAGYPHSYSPELSFMIYDDFFCKWKRLSDGTLVYLA